MERPPAISEIYHYPVTGGICILSLAVTLAAWSGKVDENLLAENYRIWHGQPWRLLTSTLLHASILHLAFNLYWTWTFGTVIERAFGSPRTALLIVILAAGSSAAEYAFSIGGVGLSGVGYGLFGFLWALGKYDRRFTGVIDASTIQLFVGWFFLCIVLTVTDYMAVGNIAHGAGAVLGAIAGYAVATRGSHRAVAIASLSALLLLALLCSSVFRRKVNFSRYGAYDLDQAGYQALTAGDYKSALQYLTEASRYRYADATTWYNLGIAQQELGQNTQALQSYHRALSLDPKSKNYRDAIQELEPAPTSQPQ